MALIREKHTKISHFATTKNKSNQFKDGNPKVGLENYCFLPTEDKREDILGVRPR